MCSPYQHEWSMCSVWLTATVIVNFFRFFLYSRKRSCTLNLAYHCQTSEYAGLTDLYNYLNSNASPGKRRWSLERIPKYNKHFAYLLSHAEFWLFIPFIRQSLRDIIYIKFKCMVNFAHTSISKRFRLFTYNQLF